MTIPKIEPITETVRPFDAEKWAKDAGVTLDRGTAMIGVLRQSEEGTELRPNSIREHPMGGENREEGLADRPSSLESALPCATEGSATLTAEKFSPAPWTITSVLSFGEFEVSDREGRDIALVYGRDDGDDAAAIPSKGNARLIAAAPEMFEALEQIMSLTGGQLPDFARAAHDIASAALAKATGEAK